LSAVVRQLTAPRRGLAGGKILFFTTPELPWPVFDVPPTADDPQADDDPRRDSVDGARGDVDPMA